jgi:hypothetical protein
VAYGARGALYREKRGQGIDVLCAAQQILPFRNVVNLPLAMKLLTVTR